jgi:hypothetical protein
VTVLIRRPWACLFKLCHKGFTCELSYPDHSESKQLATFARRSIVPGSLICAGPAKDGALVGAPQMGVEAGKLVSFIGLRINFFREALVSRSRVMNGRLRTIGESAENLSCQLGRLLSSESYPINSECERAELRRSRSRCLTTGRLSHALRGSDTGESLEQRSPIARQRILASFVRAQKSSSTQHSSFRILTPKSPDDAS